MPMSNLPLDEFASGASLVFVLQILKRYFPWLEAWQGWATRIASMVWAFVSTLLVSWEWDVTAQGNHSLTLVFPTLAAIWTFLFHWLQQFAIQEVTYQGVVNRAPWIPPVAFKEPDEGHPGPLKPPVKQ